MELNERNSSNVDREENEELYEEYMYEGDYEEYSSGFEITGKSYTSHFAFLSQGNNGWQDLRHGPCRMVLVGKIVLFSFWLLNFNQTRPNTVTINIIEIERIHILIYLKVFNESSDVWHWSVS